MNFSKVTVIGLGLIGGSLAWALKKSDQVKEVFGVDLDESAEESREGVTYRGESQEKIR